MQLGQASVALGAMIERQKLAMSSDSRLPNMPITRPGLAADNDGG